MKSVYVKCLIEYGFYDEVVELFRVVDIKFKIDDFILNVVGIVYSNLGVVDIFFKVVIGWSVLL